MLLKASEIFMTLQACRELASQVDQPFHLGITEAGGQRSGTVKSAIGLGSLLMEGIGDTIRVSLASDPVEEVTVQVDYASYVAAGEGNRKIVYDYDYELDKNEAKRQINLVQPVFVSTILDEARQTFR